MKNLVLIGGGHSHVAVLKRFAMKPVLDVRLTVICHDTDTFYSGMLPGLIAGHYSFDDAHIDLRRLVQFAGARFYKDAALDLDLQDNRVFCKSRSPVPFDICSINVGSAPATKTIPGAAEHAVPVKPISGFLSRWQKIMDVVKSRSGPFNFGIVGAGAGGVELALSAHYAIHEQVRLQSSGKTGVTFHIFDDSCRVTPTHNESVSARLARLLESRDVKIHVRERVVRVTDDGVELGSGKFINLDAVLWTTQAAAPAWLRQTDLALTNEGFIEVDDCLRSVSHGHVFAAGDVATMVNHQRERAGVMAVRQGPPLARNIRRVLESREPLPFIPPKKWLSLISTGDGKAVASWWSLSAQGSLIWLWKDWIDRRFVDKYDTFPDMSPKRYYPSMDNLDVDGESRLKTLMRCGGCAAKIGAPILTRVLSRLKEVSSNDITLFEDAAIITPPAGKVLLHSLDFFRAFIDDPYLFGRITAAHALSDLYAMGAVAHSALALAVLPPGPDAFVEEDLFLMLQGAVETFERLNVSLVGGHSGEGADMGLGFAVTGFAEPERILRKSGMKQNDALVLTKPLGTGTLLAAHMQLKAKGRWIDSALEVMLETSKAAADIFAANCATACTDVTGFGLAGHVLEMARASGIGCEIDMNSLPILEGAKETIAQGILSTLYPQNVHVAKYIVNSNEASKHPLYELLFDPQTSGGLLASVPQHKVSACLRELARVGHDAARVIGVAKGGGPILSLTGF